MSHQTTKQKQWCLVFGIVSANDEDEKLTNIVSTKSGRRVRRWNAMWRGSCLWDNICGGCIKWLAALVNSGVFLSKERVRGS